MVYDVVVSQVNCLEGISFFWKPLTCQASKHMDTNMLGAHTRSSLELLQAVVQPAKDKLNLEVPHEHSWSHVPAARLP